MMFSKLIPIRPLDRPTMILVLRKWCCRIAGIAPNQTRVSRNALVDARQCHSRDSGDAATKPIMSVIHGQPESPAMIPQFRKIDRDVVNVPWVPEIIRAIIGVVSWTCRCERAHPVRRILRRAGSTFDHWPGCTCIAATHEFPIAPVLTDQSFQLTHCPHSITGIQYRHRYESTRKTLRESAELRCSGASTNKDASIPAASHVGYQLFQSAIVGRS